MSVMIHIHINILLFCCWGRRKGVLSSSSSVNVDGITIDLHQAEFEAMDTNNDNQLDDEEVMIAMMTTEDSNHDLTDHAIEDSDVVAFIVELDQNKDGFVSWEEYKDNLQNDHEPTLNEFLPKEFENDIDGFVEAANEFARSGGNNVGKDGRHRYQKMRL
jgi:hypothetical protein